jgi:hypothetical protein
MQYNKSVGGAWLDADSLADGTKVKIVSECIKQESRFKGKDGEPKTENIAKVRTKGKEEAVNMRPNWTTIYGLIDAFGSDSKDWIDQVLTVRTVEALVGNTMRTIVYLIPEGFELGKNADKKLEIRKVGGSAAKEDVVDYPQEDINPDDIPF